jgi:shikimate dehydrogenase
VKAVAIAMGEAGEPSRILYRIFGGWGTYAAPADESSTAPGQLTASVLKELYRSNRLTSSTGVFGVIGNPVRHSKGIIVHNRLFSLEGKNSVYCRFLVKDLRRFMKHVAPLAHGFSVTIPHKEKVIPLVDTVDASARAIGAANTIIRKGKRWWATNTDAPGALDAIERVSSVEGKRMLVLGAGGASRAIAYEARRRGASVAVSNRTGRKARALAAEFGIAMVPWHSRERAEFDILVNATPIGMVPHVHRSPMPMHCLEGKIVFDAVYNPPLTRLLSEAGKVGARIIPGTEMYVHQGARQFRLYAGVPADLRMMKRVLLGGY